MGSASRRSSNRACLAFVVIVRTGRWLYAATVDLPVDVIALPFDFWFEIAKADHALEVGEHPSLGAAGQLYYVRFRCAGDPREPTWVDSSGFETVEAAMNLAKQKAPSAIIWDVAY